MRWPLFLVMAAMAWPAAADSNPHIQTIAWSPDEVTVLTGAMGWQITIEFGEDERIENVSIGDSTAWLVTPNKRARNLFLKPLRRDAATNMIVITDKRRYAFALNVAERRSSTPWIVAFDHPRPVVEVIEEPPPPAAPPPVFNYAYDISGTPALRPARVWDDGRQTYFEFGEGQAIPAIFADGPGKTETLVNVVMRGRVAVVQQLGERFTVRIGERHALVSRQEEVSRRD